MPRYYAHTGADCTPACQDWQALNEHLRAVAEGAKRRAEEARSEVAATAYLAGLLHDLGKYRPEFQQYLRGQRGRSERTRHKEAGAARGKEGGHVLVAFAVAGHHGGLPNPAAVKAHAEAGRLVAQEVWPWASVDCPELALRAPDPLTGRPRLELDLLTRLIFSCLVDADWDDTSRHEREVVRGLKPEPAPSPLAAAERLSRVMAFIQKRAAESKEPRVAALRGEVLRACLSAADQPPGLFSLTVPTGGGKTLSGLAFALRHAAQHGLRRVIYVVPYLSILDQNALVIRDALGAEDDGMVVFEHHSLAEPGGNDQEDLQQREAAARRAENWDAPVVVTTNVQFFESLFANRPGRCRKFHNIARSVILLDECQSLPADLIAPTCGMLRQLVEHLGCTVVLCTATQPAFGHVTLKEHQRLCPREIAAPSLGLFARLRRVAVEWRTQPPGLTWEQVAGEMAGQHQALCVVNTRRAARELFQALDGRGVERMHLSTAMCPAHRLAVLGRARSLLEEGKPCLLVSTQLIEAGVDIDFPVVWRELGPLESIIQAGGRCNREGAITTPDGAPGGRVIVFRSRDAGSPAGWYQLGTDTLQTTFLALGREPCIDDPADIREYFNRLYAKGDLDAKKIDDHRSKMEFADIAEKYRLIDDDGFPVVVRWAERLAEIDALLQAARDCPSRTAFRRLNRYQVNLRTYELPGLPPGAKAEDSSGLWVWYGVYDPQLGLEPRLADEVLLV